MITEFIDRFMEKQEEIKVKFQERHPRNYKDIVEIVISMLQGQGTRLDESPDPERIHEIDDGDYQGTLVYVIGAKGYQPSMYWYTRVDYGSCSGCDTLYSIRGYWDTPPSDRQVEDYMTLALHIVQRLRKMEG